jgi:hypothetical protein
MKIDPTTLASARQRFARYGDAAWLLTDPAKPRAHNAGPVIYVCDVQTGRTLMLETAPKALQQLSERTDLDEAAYHDIRAALVILIDDLLNSSGGIHPDTRRGVILGAAFCTSETRGFNITKHHDGDVQYVLVRYPDSSSSSSSSSSAGAGAGAGAGAATHRLTPLPVFKAHPIAAADLDATVTHILLSEQLNFPERFVGGLLRYQELKRNVLSGKS